MSNSRTGLVGKKDSTGEIVDLSVADDNSLNVTIVAGGGSSGGGGGAVTVANGADVALGATTDISATTDTGTASLIALTKRGLTKLTSLVSATILPASLGQKAMTASLAVVLASDQSAIPVTGTFFQATQPVSGTVTANAGTNLNTSSLALEAGGNLAAILVGTNKIPASPATDRTTAASPFAHRLSDGTTFYDAAKTGQLPTALGQNTMANSLAVVLASNQSAIPVTSTQLPSALGSATAPNNLPIVLPRKLSITGTTVSTTVTNANLLDGSGSAAATDVRDYQSGVLVIVSTATTGSYTVQIAFDSAFTIGVKSLLMQEVDVLGSNPSGSAITPTSATRAFFLNLEGANYLRVNLSTGPTTNAITAYAILNQASHISHVNHVQQATGSNLNVSIGSTGTVTVGGFSASAGTNSATNTKLVSAATTNATSVKASGGRVLSIELENTNAAVRYFHLYNKASAPTVGTDVPIKTWSIPATGVGGWRSLVFGDYGIYLATGIAYSITTGAGDADATAVGAGDVIVNMMYV